MAFHAGTSESAWNPKGAEWMELIHPEDRNRIEGDLESHLLGHTNHFEGELRMQGGDGQYRWMLCRGMAVRDETGCACRIAGSLTDITEGKVADALTGLPIESCSVNAFSVPSRSKSGELRAVSRCFI